MPRLRCNVKFPQAVSKGYWRIESPVGAKVHEESFENITTLSKELTVSPYSALVLVNAGVSMAASTVIRYCRQRVEVVTPRATITMPNKFRTKPQVFPSPPITTILHNKFRATPQTTTNPGFLIEMRNKFRTAVSVSVS